MENVRGYSDYKVLPGIYKSPNGRYVDVFCVAWDTSRDGKKVVVYTGLEDKIQYASDFKWFDLSTQKSPRQQRFVEATKEEIDELVAQNMVTKQMLSDIAYRRAAKKYTGRTDEYQPQRAQ